MDSFFQSTLFFGEEILNTMHLFIGTWFDYVMITVTTMGNEIFYIILPPVVYWCYDKSRSIKVLFIFLISVTINDMAKELSQMPRPNPLNLSPQIGALNLMYKPTSPGFPSGHTQEAVAFWGAAFWFFKNTWIRTISLLFIILIPYSRIYLGVHFLGDVVGGFIIGIIILVLLIPLIHLSDGHLEKLNKYFLIILSIALPILTYVILPGEYIYTYMGTLSGLLVGYILENNLINFNPKGTLIGAVIKIVIGLTGLLLLKTVLKLILPDYPMAHFLRYWALGFWCIFIAPYIFNKISLTKGTIEQ